MRGQGASMTDLAGSAVTSAGVGRLNFAARLKRALGDLRRRFLNALELEIAERRLFFWLPVAAGSGAIWYLLDAREPSLWYAGGAAAIFASLAFLLREKRLACGIALGLCCFCLGLLSASWRAERTAPVIDRIKVVRLEGFVEEMDFRSTGARFLLHPVKAEGFAPEALPHRIRLTLSRTPPFEAGAYVRLKARLLPPAQASLPGGYDFARDAWFAQIGAVGNVLGRVEVIAPPAAPEFLSAFMMAVDRGRNALARRVDTVIGGEPGAVAAAMVTGKRDLLADDTKDIIRQAGIFHIITISGVQMTLVAGIFFVGLRWILALSPTLVLRYPIKKWAAAAAILGAVCYDILTGSRVGTERALIMTTIMLGAVLVDRQSLSMRNLAIAAALVIVFEPDALLDASFQLSFAAVAALVAVFEARAAFGAQRRKENFGGAPLAITAAWKERLALVGEKLAHGPAALIFATFCATTATASFMANDFHELSPYVLIGNPLTLLIIEVFAVPGALIGTLLYPLGLDGFVWHYVGLGIGFVLWAARLLSSLPGATLHLTAFAPWALAFLTLAVLSAVIWRSTLLRMTAIPLALIGLCGAANGPSFDIAVDATGDTVAIRGAGGTLSVIGRHPSLFSAEQWLRADADSREPQEAVDKSACDRIGCVGILPDGRAVALVLDSSAFAEDCLRADVVVTPLYAPPGCAAWVIDRGKLQETGAVTLVAQGTGWTMTAARAADEDRPWAPAPKPHWRTRSESATLQIGDDPNAPLE
jgi:competence protein ComEC